MGGPDMAPHTPQRSSRPGSPGTRLEIRDTPRYRGAPREPWILLGVGVALLVLSGIAPHDRFTWIMEVGPILIGVPILVATWRGFPLSPLLYRLLFVHACVLMLGAHYSYAEVPLGFWVRDALGLARNHYDRLGHFMQGFVPALLAREILLRTTPLSAEVPLGFWVRDALGLARNHYDRLGHFMQGFVPALLAREILLRTTPLSP